MVSSLTTGVRALPRLPWSAGSPWRARPTTLVVLLLGLWTFGTGEALLVRSRLGNTPWTVLAEGVSRHSPLSIGAATFAISVVVLLAWIPLRERPGLGTLLNAVVIAVAIDVMLPVLPRFGVMTGKLAEVVAGILAIGIGSALYLTTWLGPGPRDGWMTGLARRTGRAIAAVRLGLEVVALGAGFALGGRVGIGTLLFAATIGHTVSAAITILDRLVQQQSRRAEKLLEPAK
jgi:uncharacterized membrane protein YczE